jgi:hypothetical protein
LRIIGWIGIHLLKAAHCPQDWLEPATRAHRMVNNKKKHHHKTGKKQVEHPLDAFYWHAFA